MAWPEDDKDVMRTVAYRLERLEARLIVTNNLLEALLGEIKFANDFDRPHKKDPGVIVVGTEALPDEN